MDATERARLSAAGRRFGLTVGGAFLALALLASWRGRLRTAMVTGAIGTLLVLGALLVPGQLGPVERAWMAFGKLLSRVTTPIFLGITWFLLLTPLGWIRRTVSRSPIARDRGAKSYWVKRPAVDAEDARRSLERQF
ncbi:MAG: hypothetical protein JWO05_354 [Gemmatimonadetes bacterium]|nr:hypothetical protein [Gemmatimonadota bacterium]